MEKFKYPLLPEYQKQCGDKMGLLNWISKRVGISYGKVPGMFNQLQNRIRLVRTEKDKKRLLNEFRVLRRRILRLQERKESLNPTMARTIGYYLGRCNTSIQYLEGLRIKKPEKREQKGGRVRFERARGGRLAPAQIRR